MRLIDADELLNDIEDVIDIENDGQDVEKSKLIILGLKIAKKYIKKARTIDAEPVKYGQWIDHEMFERNNCNPCIECSVCNTWFGCDCFPKTKFCPNCGARMRGDSE